MPGLELPIAVLRYTWKGDPPHPPDWEDAMFDKLFTSTSWAWSLPRFWSDSTLGRVDLATRSRVFPWRELSLDHALVPDPDKPGSMKCNHDRNEVHNAGRHDAGDDFHIEDFAIIIVFVDPGPSPAGNLTGTSYAVLDWNAPQSYYAHEVGHCLLLAHSGDRNGKDYGDPYCVMSALTSTLMFSLIGAPPDPDMPEVFWSNLGCLASAAEVKDWLRHTASVIELPGDALDQHESVTLRTFTTANFGDPVLATLDIGGELWTAEYRIPTGWDRALPSKALVIHKIRFPPNPGESATVLYMGAIRIPFDRGIDSWEDPLGSDIGAVVSYADDDRVTFHFRRREGHRVQLHEERLHLSTSRGPQSRKKFPIYDGLCGDGEFDYYWANRRERIKLAASPTGYSNPSFAWKVNGQAVTPGSPVTFATTQYVDDGTDISTNDVTVTVATRAADDSSPPRALPANEIWLENNPSDGTFDISFEVDVDQQPSAPPVATASASDEFEGQKIIIDGKEEADRRCRDYWDQIGKKLPKSELTKFIDKGDPVWRILERSAPEDGREQLAQFVAVARALARSEPEQSHEIAQALARRLNVPENVIVPRLG